MTKTGRRNRPPRQEVAPRGEQPDEASLTVEIEHRQNWSGPIPPPSILRDFDDIIPGCAERIIAQFELEGAHRRQMEDRAQRFRIREAHIGQVLAGLFAVGAFGSSIVAMSYGAFVLAGVLGGSTILAGIAAFQKQPLKPPKNNV